MSHFHVYSLPIELLDTLTPRNLVSEPRPRSASPAPLASTSTTGSRACNVCNGTTFIDVEEQRAHFRSDWHRYNVKTRLNGGQSVSELEFSKLVDGTPLLLPSLQALMGFRRTGGLDIWFRVGRQ